MSVKVVTGVVRLSYPHLSQPDPTYGKYSCVLLIPKSDTVTVKAMQDAVREAADEFRAKYGAQSLPEPVPHTIHDGDGLKNDGTPYGPECAGCLVISVSSNTQPRCFDNFKNEITDYTKLYSGCYVRSSLGFAGYNTKGNRGVTAYLNGLQFVRDGEPFGGDVADDFTPIDVAVEDDPLFA